LVSDAAANTVGAAPEAVDEELAVLAADWVVLEELLLPHAAATATVAAARARPSPRLIARLSSLGDDMIVAPY
jgi:hypothetical protein